MEEKEFIYGKLKYLTEQVDHLYQVIDRQQNMIDNLTKIIGIMQSPEYAKKQAKTAEMADIADKLAFIKSLNKKR